MSNLIPISDAWLDEQYRKISTYTQTALGLGLYGLSVSHSEFSLLIGFASICALKLAKYSGRQAQRKGTFFRQWENISTDRHEDSLYQYMEPDKRPQIDVPKAEQLKEVNLPKLLSTEIKSSIILGAPRGGKGYVTASALRSVPDDVEPFLIDPKDDLKERYYWELIPEDNRVHFDACKTSSADVIELCTGLFNKFLVSNAKRKLLIIDESSPGLSTVNKKWFKSWMLQCARMASIGPSKGYYIWILAQSATVDELGISNANKGGYRIVAVGNRDTPSTWFDSINRSLSIGLPDESLFSQSCYIANDGSSWGVSRVPEVSRKVSTIDRKPHAETAETFSSYDLPEAPGVLTKDKELAVLQDYGMGNTLSTALKNEGLTGRNYQRVKEYLFAAYPDFFSDSTDKS